MGVEMQVAVAGAASDREAIDAAMERVSKSFHVRSVTAVAPKKQSPMARALWSAGGFFKNIHPDAR